MGMEHDRRGDCGLRHFAGAHGRGEMVFLCSRLHSSITPCTVWCFFFFQALNFLVESYGLLYELFPVASILDAGYPVFFLSSFGRCPF
jgi:hypothetical protein